MIEICAFTDGSAVVNGKHKGHSGYATYFPNLYGEKKIFARGFKQGKTGQMELIAVITAISKIKVTHKEEVILTIYSDSQYVVKTFTENRLRKWIQNNWINSSGKVKNRKLWEFLLSLLNERPFLKLEMVHVKGHKVDKEKDPKKRKQMLSDTIIQGNYIADHYASYKRFL